MQVRPAEAGGWRLLVAAFTLFAFACQGYLTQTHIHIPPPGSAGLAAKSGAGTPPKVSSTKRTAPGEKVPPDDDPVKCPLCQAVGYAGHFVSPAAAATLLPAAAISILPLSVVILSPGESPSHIWQGRGPPSS